MNKVKHYDYFGNLIEVGDEIIRPIYSELEKRKVVKITPGAIFIGITRRKNNGTANAPDWETVPGSIRLNARWVASQLINLSKIKIEKI